MSISVFEHAITSHRHHADIVTTARARIQIPVGHDVLGVRLLRGICSYLAYLEQGHICYKEARTKLVAK